MFRFNKTFHNNKIEYIIHVSKIKYSWKQNNISSDIIEYTVGETRMFDAVPVFTPRSSYFHITFY